MLPPDLADLLGGPAVTDVLLDPRGSWVDRGDGLQPAGLDGWDEERLRGLAVRLAASAGRRLDAAAPFADVRLPGGLRLHAVLPPVASMGTCLSFRVLRRPEVPLAELVGSPQLCAVLVAVVRTRLSFVVTGGTGSGKTTLLAALLGEADPAERVVLVEDTGELSPRLPHVVHLEARAPNVEGAGEVTQPQLVRQALRMRPDRLVVGEVRGAELADLLMALNTGHEGGATTLHANGVADVPARLEALGSMAGLDRAAVASQVSAALSVVVHVRRRPAAAGGRHVAAVGLLTRGADGCLQAAPALEVGPASVGAGSSVQAGPAAAQLHALLARRGHPPW